MFGELGTEAVLLTVHYQLELFYCLNKNCAFIKIIE